MPNQSPNVHPGLCAACKHMSRVETPRASTFVMCNLSKTDPTFPKYPRLPVLQCHGYKLDAKKQRSTHSMSK